MTFYTHWGWGNLNTRATLLGPPLLFLPSWDDPFIVPLSLICFSTSRPRCAKINCIHWMRGEKAEMTLGVISEFASSSIILLILIFISQIFIFYFKWFLFLWLKYESSRKALCPRLTLACIPVITVEDSVFHSILCGFSVAFSNGLIIYVIKFRALGYTRDLKPKCCSRYRVGDTDEMTVWCGDFSPNLYIHSWLQTLGFRRSVGETLTMLFKTLPARFCKNDPNSV